MKKKPEEWYKKRNAGLRQEGIKQFPHLINVFDLIDTALNHACETCPVRKAFEKEINENHQAK